MANTQAIKGRIKSVKNTKQITKAMELVAASKMRKAQEATLASRAYRNMAREILTRINKETNVSDHIMYKSRPVQTKLYILVTSDRGLAGAYNASILKMLASIFKEDEAQGIKSKTIVIGKQGARFLSKVEGLEVVGVYENFADNPTTEDIAPILNTALELFSAEANGVEQVDVVYTDFVSTIKQDPRVQTILPAAFEEAESPQDLREDVPFEPSAQAVIETITPKLVEVQLYQNILESQASEQVSRMLAMKNASDNASDIIDALTLEFNSARQASITQEIAEITAGSEAMV